MAKIKVTRDKVRKAKEMYAEGVRVEEISEKLEASKAAIYKWLNGDVTVKPPRMTKTTRRKKASTSAPGDNSVVIRTILASGLGNAAKLRAIEAVMS